MVQAFITADVLRWARERASASIESVAAKLDVSPDLVRAWETGETLPSFAKAQAVAKYLRVPFGYLFLENPPAETIQIPDFRRIGGEPIDQLGPDFRDIYLDAVSKQDWYRDYLLQQRAEPLGFVGSFRTTSEAADIAADIRRVLGITSEWRHGMQNWEAMFRGLVTKTEAAGVIVLRNSIVGNNTHRPLSVQEFRGFALTDSLAPLVFINSGDAPAAQIFSLVHELAHIWLNISAISNFGLQATAEGFDPLEVLCNKVAAEFLVARQEFLSLWQSHLTLEENAHSLAREFRVSTLVIARRALDLGRINRNDYLAFYARAAEAREQAPERDARSGGPDFYTLSRMRNSPTLARAVITEAVEGRMLFRDAGQLLSVKPDKLKKLAQKLEG